jgi:hypothetical protein
LPNDLGDESQVVALFLEQDPCIGLGHKFRGVKASGTILGSKLMYILVPIHYFLEHVSDLFRGICRLRGYKTLIGHLTKNLGIRNEMACLAALPNQSGYIPPGVLPFLYNVCLSHVFRLRHSLTLNAFNPNSSFRFSHSVLPRIFLLLGKL